ncbi:hypothetical protein WN982_20795 [Paraburkholderia sp. IMGN_8]|uniref:hypothetical protein n=1 Tax=Paraburkholderia sp. IMGN_8 TaxID=3136564 RepID=UPI0031016F17
MDAKNIESDPHAGRILAACHGGNRAQAHCGAKRVTVLTPLNDGRTVFLPLAQVRDVAADIQSAVFAFKPEK